MRRRREQPPVMRREDGSIVITLADTEREALSGLFDQLDALLAGNPDDPRLKRLYPAAYHQDPGLDAEYRSLMMPELVASRALAITKARDAIGTADPLDPEQALSFMTVINSLRLVLGTMLDVGEGDEPDLDPSDPGYDQLQLYGYLGWLLEWTVDAIGGE